MVSSANSTLMVMARAVSLLAGRLGMREVALDQETMRLLVGRFVFMLKGLKEAENVGEHGFESTSWRGQLLGFRYAVEIMVGSEKTSEILGVLRELNRAPLAPLIRNVDSFRSPRSRLLRSPAQLLLGRLLKCHLGARL